MESTKDLETYTYELIMSHTACVMRQQRKKNKFLSLMLLKIKSITSSEMNN